MSKTQSAFSRYAPFIQDYIYRKNWSDLREVQVEACREILDTKNNLIIASGTASGKTEAAFFPILTDLEKHPSESISVLYIGPLKALINDQFQRLNELLESQDIPVWPWHGDTNYNLRKKALKENRGIIQITPESLESLVMRNPGNAKKLFSDLRYVIIDEIHALMGQDRGLQVMCLINRIERLTGNKPRRVGLSATLSDYKSAEEFLSSGTTRKTKSIGINNQQRKFQVSAESFRLPATPEGVQYMTRKYFEYLYGVSHTKKCLIFTNSRNEAERTIAYMKAIAEERGDRDIFYTHHGSISMDLRHEAEHALKLNDGPTVAAATITLELGIDIGDLDRIIQIGAPYSCSSFVQRLGRSGRRSGVSQMLFVNLFDDSNNGLNDKIPWDLLRAIAVIQLYTDEKWIEPFELKKKPYSLLIHQTLSTLYAFNGLTPPELAKNVLTLAPFIKTISKEEYAEILRYMLQNEYLERLESGELIIGLKAEGLVSHYSFYSVFANEKEYQVLSEKGPVGTLDSCPSVGEVFVLGGTSWKVQSVDEERKKVYVESFQSNRIPSWMGNAADIHPKIVKQIKRILEDETVYPFLQKGAKNLLVSTRDYVQELGLLDRTLTPLTDHTFLLCPWTGTKQVRTLYQLLQNGLRQYLKIINVINMNYYLEINSSLTYSEFIKRLRKLKIDLDNPDPSLVLSEKQAPLNDKFDYMLPDDLLREAYIQNQMDLPAAVEILKSI